MEIVAARARRRFFRLVIQDFAPNELLEGNSRAEDENLA
jgi:hypothetical protein